MRASGLSDRHRDELDVAVQLKMAVGRAASPAASAPSPTSASFVDTAAVPTVTLETNKMGEPSLSPVAQPEGK